MKQFVKIIIGIILTAAFIATVSSCKRYGCLDPDAVNFDSKADYDDGTCYCNQISELETITSGHGIYYTDAYHYTIAYVSFRYYSEKIGYVGNNCNDQPETKYFLEILNITDKKLTCDIYLEYDNNPSYYPSNLFSQSFHVEQLLSNHKTIFEVGHCNVDWVGYEYYCYVGHIVLG